MQLYKEKQTKQKQMVKKTTCKKEKKDKKKRLLRAQQLAISLYGTHFGLFKTRKTEQFLTVITKDCKL